MRSILLIIVLFLSATVMAQHKNLNKLFTKGEFEQVIGEGTSKLNSLPEDPVLNMLVGRAYIALHNYKKAIPFLKKAYYNDVADSSVKSWSLADLGTAYYHTGQTKLGVKNLKDATELKLDRKCRRYAQSQLKYFQENDFFQKWDVQETEHVRFHFQDKSAIEDIENYKNKHEVAYQNINKFFKVELSKKIDLFVWKNKGEAFDLFQRSIGFAKSDSKIVNVWYKESKGYEICNILCDVAIKPIKKTKLIDKGLCVYLEQIGRNKISEARKVTPKDEFFLLELWESPTRYERGLSYPVGAAFIDFLIRKEGQVKMKKLLKDQTIENAKVIYPDFMELVKVFEAMVKS